jgi:LacI family transcriptional regulator
MARIRNVALSLNLMWPARWAYETFAGVRKYAAERGRWQWTIDQFPQARLPAERGAAMPYDGIICRVTQALARRARRIGIPLVNTWCDSPVQSFPSVLPDFAATGRADAEHLVSRGFRRFSYFIAETTLSQRRHYQGFSGRLAEAGLSCEIAYHPRRWNDNASQWARMRRAIVGWLESLTPPVAVFIERPVIARLVATVCPDLGRRVPQDVAIFCGIDTPIICEHTEPSLTCSDYNYELQGYEAARLLDAMMSGKSPPARPILIPPPGVIQRASTDFFAVEDKLVAEALRFIAANIHKQINAHSVVEALAVSRSTLQRAFRNHMHVAVSDEITRLRLEKAKRLLLDPESHTLKQVAAESGWRSSKELCRVFRRKLGMTPGQYRKKLLGERR